MCTVRIALLLIIALTGFEQTTVAQNQAKQLFERWDVDKNGSLVRSELPQNLRRNFERVDENDDGKISMAEHIAFLKRRGPRNTKPVEVPNVIVKRDLSYVANGHERHKLDLYLPTHTDGPRPLVVWIHGGAWRKGSKNNCPAAPLVARGFVVASINYRLSHDAVFPAQIHDCKAAIRWLRANANKHGIAADRIGVWGSSAGGHLVALLGTSGDVADLEGDLGNTDQSSRVQAVCDWFGPTDLLLMNKQAGESGKLNHDARDSPESQLLGGPLQEQPKAAKRAAPLTYVTSDDPPFLIVHGDKDVLVPWQQSQVLADLLKQAKCDVKLKIIAGAGHGRFKDSRVSEDSMKFFESVLLQPAKPAEVKK